MVKQCNGNALSCTVGSRAGVSMHAAAQLTEAHLGVGARTGQMQGCTGSGTGSGLGSGRPFLSNFCAAHSCQLTCELCSPWAGLH